MSDDGLLSIGEVNDLDLDQFLWLFENVIEKTSEAASYVHSNRPFKNITHISMLFNKYLDTLSIEGLNILGGKRSNHLNETFITSIQMNNSLISFREHLAKIALLEIFSDQEELLRKVPDFGVKTLISDELTRELENAGMTELSDNEYEELQENNFRYREKFGFPFVICVQENTLTSIFEAIQNRLENDKLTELKIGIDEMKKIGKHRLFKLVWHD